MPSLTQVLIEYNDQRLLVEAGKRLSSDELYADFNILRSENYQRITLSIHPKQAVTIKNVELQFARNYKPEETIFCNGFQSWSESREWQQEEKLPRLSRLARPFRKYFGDEYIDGIQRGSGWFHSWTYTYVRQGQSFDFMGSMLDRTGFVLIQHLPQNNLLTVRKDCAGLQLQHSYPVFDLLLMEGKEKDVFDTYFSMLECPPPAAPPMTGWTSRHQVSSHLSEEIFLNNPETSEVRKVPFQVLQMDDGYQQKVGDWLETKSTFPKGMAAMAAKIKSKGYQPGIWQAPFVCEKKSALFQQHPDWLLQNKNGKPIKAGYNARWGGWFYALNFYHPAVQEYLTGVFFTIINKWGFELVKLDFLFAACIKPPVNKTRGQVMHEVMVFLRQLAGTRRIMAGGVPLASAFGLVDYCRIGPDIHLQWEHRNLKTVGLRERPSTLTALRTLIGRWQLTGRAFQADPDIFLLRENGLGLSPAQQYTLLICNSLLGDLHCTSDDLANYSDEQWSEFQELFYWQGSKVEKVEQAGIDRYAIFFKHQEKSYAAAVNLSGKGVLLAIGGMQVTLEAYESLVISQRP